MADNPPLRAEIREFLVSRRARITPEQAGLRVFGTSRRIAGLRREEMATLAGVSAEYYTRVERGNVTGVSESVLDGIAHALQLDEAERAHLANLVRSAGSIRRAPRRPSTQLPSWPPTATRTAGWWKAGPTGSLSCWPTTTRPSTSAATSRTRPSGWTRSTPAG
jgi:transcriptional regulator with XRE-family HTH domain